MKASTREMAEKILLEEGVVLTPMKTAVERVFSGGDSVETVKAQQEEDKKRKIEEERKAAEEKERIEQEKSRALAARAKTAEDHAASKGQQVDTLIAELNAVKERERKEKQEMASLRAQLQEFERLKQQLNNATLSVDSAKVSHEDTVAPVVVHIPDDPDFIPYGAPYIHTARLKQPDDSLDVEKKRRIESLRVSTKIFKDGLLASAFYSSLGSALKTRGKKISIKIWLDRLTNDLDDFDAHKYVTLFKAAKRELSVDDPTKKYDYDSDDAYKAMHEDIQWFERMGGSLSQVEDLRYYSLRQLSFEKAVLAKVDEFNDFYVRFLDQTVESVCLLLVPTDNDEENVVSVKQTLALKLRTKSIIGVKEHLEEKIKFGTPKTFLSQTFQKAGKVVNFANFISVLESYDSLWIGAKDTAPLVEATLTYMFYQNRFKTAQRELASMDIDQIGDIHARKVLQEMRDEDVLSYRQKPTERFVETVTKALDSYTSSSKKAIMPGEIVIVNKVLKILAYYLQIHEFSNILKEKNPIMVQFHE